MVVVGPPGIGKTRLAAQFAAKRAVWCDLSQAADAEGICSLVAAALGVPLSPREPAEAIGRALAARRRVLLVLDTFEHLVDFAESTLGMWLEAAPRARFVVTSRKKLHRASAAGQK